MPVCVTDDNKNRLILSFDRQIPDAPSVHAPTSQHRLYNRQRALHSDIFNFHTPRYNKDLTGPILSGTVPLPVVYQNKEP